MVEFFLHPKNIPFAIAFAVLIGVLLLEVIGLLIGFSTMNGDAADIDLDVDADSNFIQTGLGWLYLGKVPTMAWLAVFAGVFAASGYTIQSLTRLTLPTWIPVLGAICVSMIAAREVSRLLSKTVFREDSTAIATDSLLGNLATVTLGDGRKGQPTQAKVKDPHGQTHYVIVEPESEEHVLAAGSEVILLRREGPKFFAVPNSTDAVMALDDGSATVNQ